MLRTCWCLCDLYYLLLSIHTLPSSSLYYMNTGLLLNYSKWDKEPAAKITPTILLSVTTMEENPSLLPHNQNLVGNPDAHNAIFIVLALPSTDSQSCHHKSALTSSKRWNNCLNSNQRAESHWKEKVDLHIWLNLQVWVTVAHGKMSSLMDMASYFSRMAVIMWVPLLMDLLMARVGSFSAEAVITKVRWDTTLLRAEAPL